MDFCWIKSTAGLQNGVELINKIEPVKFQKLLSHIVQNMNRTDSCLFTEDEQVSLEKVLNLDSHNVTLVVKTISHIIKKMKKFIMRPVCVLNDLTNTLAMDKDKAQLFVHEYKVLVSKQTEEFLIKNLANIREVTNANWQVNLEMSSSKNSLEKNTTVLYSLETDEKSDPDGEVMIEFDIEELKDLYQKIDVIQNEVDKAINN